MPNQTLPFLNFSLSKLFVAICVTIAATWGVLSPAFAEPIHTRLNPDLVPGGAIGRYAVSPDGSQVAYIADQETDGVDELFLVSIEGGATIKLNPSLVAGGNVYGFRFTPDGKYVVYIADQEVDNRSSIYSVPSIGGTAVDLVDELPDGSFPVLYYYKGQPISADSSRLLYTLEKRENGVPREYALLSTPIDQCATVNLTSPLVANGGVWNYKISPNGKTVVYLADQEVDGKAELYSIPIQGGTLTKLNLPLQSDDSVEDFYFSPNGSYVIYMARVEGQHKLYRVSLNNGTATEIGEATSFISFHENFSPDGSKFLYTTQDGNGGSEPSVYELYVAPLAEGEPILLSSSVDTEGSNTAVNDAEFTPDGSQVIFAYTADGGMKHYLYSVPSHGGAKTKLVGYPDLPARNNGNYYFKMAPDGKSVVQMSYDYTSNRGDLYSTDLTTRITNQLNGAIKVKDSPFYFSADGTKIIFLGQTDQSLPQQIVQISAGTTTTLSVASTLDVDSFWIAPFVHDEQTCVVYRLGTFSSQVPFRDLYASCAPSNWSNHAYLPTVLR